MPRRSASGNRRTMPPRLPLRPPESSRKAPGAQRSTAAAARGRRMRGAAAARARATRGETWKRASARQAGCANPAPQRTRIPGMAPYPFRGTPQPTHSGKFSQQQSRRMLTGEGSLAVLRSTMTSRLCALRVLYQVSIGAAAFMLGSAAFALPPELSLRQFHHTAWTADDGAPTGIESLAQTSDGYLWIAASAGLFRFDGVRFERVVAIHGQRLPSNDVMTLFTPATGGLWIGYRFGGATFVSDGKAANYGTQEGLPLNTVMRFTQDRAGVVWANTSGSLRRFNGSTWESAPEKFKLPIDFAKNMRVALDGSLWVATGGEVMVLRAGQTAFEATAIRTSEGQVEFLEAPDGSLWLTDEQLGARAVQVPHDATRASKRWIALRDAHGEPIWGKLVDRDGSLWTASSTGIHRMKDVARLLDPRFEAGSLRDVYSSVDGLSAPYAAAFLEDREGNIWIGTAGGLDRFRESRLTPVDFPRAANGFAMAAGDSGAMLVGIDHKEGTFEVKAPSAVSFVPGPESIQCAYRADDGVVWLGGRGMLWHSSGSPP